MCTEEDNNSDSNSLQCVAIDQIILIKIFADEVDYEIERSDLLFAFDRVLLSDVAADAGQVAQIVVELRLHRHLEAGEQREHPLALTAAELLALLQISSDEFDAVLDVLLRIAQNGTHQRLLV